MQDAGVDRHMASPRLSSQCPSSNIPYSPERSDGWALGIAHAFV
jgi:hypothetical protein